MNISEEKELRKKLLNLQNEIEDLNNMLEKLNENFESVLLETLQATESILPKIICERIIFSLMQSKKIFGNLSTQKFTRRRIMKEKVKNLKSLLSVIDKINLNGNHYYEKSIQRENVKLMKNFNQILKISDNFIKDLQIEKQFDFPICKEVHSIWQNIRSNKKWNISDDWKISINSEIDEIQHVRETSFLSLFEDCKEMKILKRNVFKLNEKINKFKQEMKQKSCFGIADM